MNRLLTLFCLATTIPLASCGPDPDFDDASLRAEQGRRAIAFCRSYFWGWMSHADPRSRLLPDRLRGDGFWNSKDSAADNYPFLVLTAYITGDPIMREVVQDVLVREQRYTNRVGRLPDEFAFETQTFRYEEVDMDRIIFGASEYAKDGLLPIVEWLGESPWLTRMEELITDMWRVADVPTEGGLIPSDNIEVHGELLQVMSRLYWLRGDDTLKEWIFRIADHYLLEQDMTSWPELKLDNHGGEILGGLSEAYIIAIHDDPERRKLYRPRLHAWIDQILEVGTNEDGMMYMSIRPAEKKPANDKLSANWGYNYDAILTVGQMDERQDYIDAVRKPLSNLSKYVDFRWEEGGADGTADAVEGALNLLSRLPDDSAVLWVDRAMEFVIGLQRPDGVIEGWYGDGNSARTALQYALWKSQGVRAVPWRSDVAVGAVETEDGGIAIHVDADWAWVGELVFDAERHRDNLGLPFDYARINQFPEWFTVHDDAEYRVEQQGAGNKTMRGSELRRYPLHVTSGERARLWIRPR